MTNEIQISIRAYAKQLQVDESAVRDAIDKGKIKKGVVYSFKMRGGKKTKVPKIIASVANKEWGFVHENPKPQRGLSAEKVASKLDNKTVPENNNSSDDNAEELKGFNEKEYTYTDLLKAIKVTPNLKYSEAIRRQAVLQIAKDKMELEELQGSLVRKVDVEKSLFAVGDELKKKLFSIPARCLDNLRAAKNKIEATNILTSEINQVLESIASLNV